MAQEIKKTDSKEQDIVNELDLMNPFLNLLKERIFILKNMMVGLILGLIICFSIPKKYRAYAILAPEMTLSTNSSINGMAAILGFGNMGHVTGKDALNINKAEDIVTSTPFVLELMNVHVKTVDDRIDTTLVGYIGMQKQPWWNMIISLPGKAIGGIIKIFDGSPQKENNEINPFHLTKKQYNQILAISSSINAKTDKKTGLIEISSAFQDPMVAALVTDSVMSKLQKYLTNYKTQKYQQDCNYLETLYNECQKDYYLTQERYARYIDANQNLIRKVATTEVERLKNDMNLAYQIYSQVASQLQVARAKVQEEKPIFTVIEPASVPLKAFSPNKKLIVVTLLLLTFICSSIWILWGKEFVLFFKACLNSVKMK